jgi:capsular exopolysaccharide synthesis family protein
MTVKQPASTPRPATTAAGPEPLSLGQLLLPLRRNWGTVALLALCGAAAALLIGFQQEPVYQATALLELQGINEDVLNLRNLALPAGEASLEPYLQTQVKILESPELLRRVAGALDLRNREEFNAGRDWGVNLFRTPVPGGNDQLIKQVSRHLNVRVSGQTRIIEILAESSDPRLASALANTVSNEYIEYTLARRANSTRTTSESLADQLQEQKVNLERSEDALQRYARENGLLYTSETNNIAEAKLQQLQDALSKSQATRILEQSRYERVLASPPDSLPEVLDDSTLRSYQVKLTDLKLQMAELSSTLTPEHFKVQEVRDQIVELEAALGRGRARVLARIKNQYESAERREKLEAAAYAAQAGLVEDQAAKSVRYKSLKQEAESNRRLYEAMLQKVKETGIASAIRATNVQVLNAATVPEIPAGPNLPLHAAAGLFVGIFAGMTLVFARGNKGSRIRVSGDAGACLGYPELGVIPYAYNAAGGWSPFRYLRRPAGNGEDGQVEGGAAAFLKQQAASGASADSPMAESIRAALASVLFSAPPEQSRVLAITSASPGEGKTTIASNFAIALAQTGQRVLLVDGHLRHPRLHEVFGVPNTEGLSDLIEGPASRLGYRTSDRCVSTDVAGLSLLTAGTGGAGMVNRLYSPRVPQLFECLRDQFDAIVVDTAPLSLLESRPLARAADGVVMVIGVDRTPRDTALAALRRLDEDGATVLGTVLNGCGAPRIAARGVGALAFPAPANSCQSS